MGEEYGSWVEGGLLTHSTALAPPRAAPHGAQPTHNPHNPRIRALSQWGGRGSRQWKYWIAPTTPPRSMFSFGPRRMLPLSERAVQVANSPFTPVEVFCIREGASRNLHPATRNSPPGVSASPYTPPPQPSTKTHTGLRPTQDLGVPLPETAKGSPQTHTYPLAPVSRTPSKLERVPGLAVLRKS